MRETSEWLDRGLRAVLGLPGLALETLDGRRVHPDTEAAEQVFPSIRREARHPEAYLALEAGLHYHHHGERLLAYQHRGRTAFGVGGLNVPPEDREAVLRSFSDDTSRAGMVRQLMFPLRSEELASARSAGFAPVQVGVEGWLALPTLTFAGKRFATVRQMRNRARRRGVRWQEVRPESCRTELEAIHDAWLASKRPSWRMKLLVGSPSLEQPFDRRYVVARTSDRIEAFVTVLPGAAGEWGIDVMCRRPDAVAGAMDGLVAHVAELLRAEGQARLSLGACPMAGIPAEGPYPLLRGVFRALYGSTLGNRLFGFRSLYRFKQKFRPSWQPVFFAAAPHLGVLALYRGCRMWGLY